MTGSQRAQETQRPHERVHAVSRDTRAQAGSEARCPGSLGGAAHGSARRGPGALPDGALPQSAGSAPSAASLSP